jgi:iron complex outermembrane recepter protein
MRSHSKNTNTSNTNHYGLKRNAPGAKKALALAVATFSACSLPALGQAEGFFLEEVIVTAQKREQNLQDVPVSVNVVGGEQIAESGIGDLEELSGLVPNLSINESPQGLSIYIRGLGSGDNQGFEQSVGLFIDGVYAGRSRQFQAPFLDVAAVEVLRGPQGTLFGKNTIAGAMTVTTAKPTDELEASLQTSYEPRFNSYSVEGVVSGPITEDLKGRLAVSQSESGGFMKNTALDSDEPDSLNTVVRGTLLWEPTDELDVQVKYEQGRAELSGRNYVTDEVGPWGALYSSNDAGFDVSDPYKRSVSTKESSDTNSESFTLNVNYDLGEYQLTSITGYSEYQHEGVVDGDSSALDAAVFPQEQDFHQWSQELRLTSPLGGDVDFIAGLFFQTSDLSATRRLDSNLSAYSAVNASLAVIPPTGFQAEFDQQTETYAAFGSATWHVSDLVHLTAGLRYTIEEKEADRDLYFTGYNSQTPLAQVYDPAAAPIAPLPVNTYALAVGGQHTLGVYEHQVEGDRRAENLSPSLKIQYDFSDDVMLYASISKAFKSGGFNEFGNQGDDPGEYALSPESFDFDEEKALAFELGGKTSLFDGTAKLNFALFRTEYTDLQVSTFKGDTFSVGNAAEAISQGLEMDGTVRLSETLYLNASMAYLDASYSEFENASCTVAQAAATVGTCTQDLTDRELANAPKWTGNIALDHEYNIGQQLLLRSHLDVSYTDKQYLATDLDPHTLEDAHTTVNARIGLGNADGSWELALVGKNLTDEEVRSWSNDPFLLSGSYFSYYEPPRTLAVQFNLNY